MNIAERIDKYLSEGWGTHGVKWKKPHAKTKRLGSANAFIMQVHFSESEEDPGFDKLQGEGVLLISYATPVALATGKKFYQTDRKWSVTTSAQISRFRSQLKAWDLEHEVKSQEWFNEMWKYIREKYK